MNTQAQKKLIQQDLKYNWHPYTQTAEYKDFPPIPIVRARGIKLFLPGGSYLYDVISSWWCNVHGHGHPEIVRAIAGQAKKLDHVLFAGTTHEAATLLAKQLIEIAPQPLARVFFSDNGSTAVETALKMSFQYWRDRGRMRKRKFVFLEGGYHGDTIGAMSVSGVELFNQTFKSLFFDGYHLPQPPPVDLDMNCDKKLLAKALAAAERIIGKHHAQIAALIIEPMIQAAGGMHIYPAEYLKKICRIARKYRIHVIVDEVATGFGRTGKLFASDYADLKPDFMCLSKGLTSGTLPMGATLVSEKIHNAFTGAWQKKTFFHGHTFTANPIAASAALASLKLFKRTRILQSIQSKNKLIAEELSKLTRYDFVARPRALGMVGAVDIVRSGDKAQSYPASKRVGLIFYREALKNQLLLRPLGSVVYVYLPLVTTESQIKQIFKRIHKVFAAVQSMRAL